MITVRLIGGDRLMARLDAISGRIQLALVRRGSPLGCELERHVGANRLSLRVRAGSSREAFGRPIRRRLV